MAKCGAKKRNGDKCRSPAMSNGKCRLHGGATPATNQNAVTHGFYSNCFTDKEKENLHKLKYGTLIDELTVARVQLARASSKDETDKDYKPELIERFLNTVGRLEKQHAEISVDDPQGEFNQEDEFL